MRERFSVKTWPTNGASRLQVPITRAAARMGHSPDVFRSLYTRDNDEIARQDAMRELAGELYG